jgi:hypothetical protein
MAEIGFVGGYAMELEDKTSLNAMCVEAPVLMMGELPTRVDIRRSILSQLGWMKMENQGQIGSCQGQSLSECLEYCYVIVNPSKVMQYSRMYAYIASQMENNIRTDSGSTLEGGTRAARKGICEESIGPYTSRYPGWSWITDAMRQNAVKHRLQSVVEMKSAEHIKQFIGSGIGIVQIGISWGNEMTPDSRGCITSFSGRGGGGHAVVFAGYVPDEDVGVKSSAGWWLLMKNSWGERWGKGGYAYVNPRACDQMLKHRFTSMYGRSELETPRVRPLPVDWTKESLLG